MDFVRTLRANSKPGFRRSLTAPELNSRAGCIVSREKDRRRNLEGLFTGCMQGYVRLWHLRCRRRILGPGVLVLGFNAAGFLGRGFLTYISFSKRGEVWGWAPM